jgi:hypothetical protein
MGEIVLLVFVIVVILLIPIYTVANGVVQEAHDLKMKNT